VRKASFVVSHSYQNKKIFQLDNPILNRDNCLYPFYLLCQELRAKHSIDLSTQDINPISDSEFVLYNEMPSKLPTLQEKAKSFLLLYETELIRPDNWDINKHKRFQKIFTWNDTLVDGKRYIKMNYAQQLRQNTPSNNKTKFCAVIAGNKSCRHPKELYSKRVEAIRWFEKNHPEEFDLYGIGWDKMTFKKPFGRLNRLEFLRNLFHRRFPGYKGTVESKQKILKDYSYSICYENARDIPGYITEKIFDCFFAFCVPIYWGAPNVTDFIPANTFIDKRSFKTYEELYSYMKNMSEAEYKGYLDNIQRFLQGEQIKAFSAEEFVKTIIKNIVEDFQNA
jgi:hypothetical protein